MTAVWCVWKERNAYIFSNKVPSVAAWKALFTQEVKLQLCRFHPSSPLSYDLVAKFVKLVSHLLLFPP